jgi:hypothetical protein
MNAESVSRVRLRRLLLVLLFCAALPASAADLQIVRVEPIGTFSTNAPGWGRDAGFSALVGSSIVWMFGDTFLPGDRMRSATAAWSSPSRPSALREAVDEDGLPFQLYPLSRAEEEFARAHATPPACCKEGGGCPPGELYCRCPLETDCWVRYALWPGSVITVGAREAINFYESVIAGVAPYDFRHVGTGLARIEAGSTVATRLTNDDGEPLLLFAEPEPNFLRAVRTAREGADFIYVYANANRAGCGVDVLLARVRPEDAARRDAYRFWAGGYWVDTLALAVPILDDVPGGLGQVVWNDHLQRYLSAFSDVCTGGAQLHVRSAPRPEGPWGAATNVDLSPLGATDESYAGMLHEALGTGRTVTLTFYRPEADGTGKLHLARLVLR